MLVVGVGDFKVSRDPAEVITTYALGSCIGVTIHDPVARVGGLLHFMLPDSALDAAKSKLRPCMFADTGLVTLMQAALELGASRTRAQVRIAGGAQLLDAQGIFSIGKRNYAAVRKLLWKAGLMIQSEDIGGTVSRTVRLDVGTGQTWVRSTSTGEEAVRTGVLRNGGPEWQLMC